jgi:hypothetical protein
VENCFCPAYFISTGTPPLPGLPTGTADFTALQDGTIQGVIDISLAGSGVVTGMDSSYVNLIIGNLNDGLYYNPNTVTIISSEIVPTIEAVPEPSSVYLLLASLMVVAVHKGTAHGRVPSHRWRRTLGAAGTARSCKRSTRSIPARLFKSLIDVARP